MNDFQDYLTKDYRKVNPIEKYGHPLVTLFRILEKAFETKSHKVEIYPNGGIWFYEENDKQVNDLRLDEIIPSPLSFLKIFLSVLEEDPILRENISILSKSDEKVVFTFNYEEAL